MWALSCPRGPRSPGRALTSPVRPPLSGTSAPFHPALVIPACGGGGGGTGSSLRSLPTLLRFVPARVSHQQALRVQRPSRLPAHTRTAPAELPAVARANAPPRPPPTSPKTQGALQPSTPRLPQNTALESHSSQHLHRDLRQPPRVRDDPVRLAGESRCPWKSRIFLSRPGEATAVRCTRRLFLVSCRRRFASE